MSRNQYVIDFDAKAAEVLKEDGMNRAVLGAESLIPGWGDMAFEMLKTFLMEHAGQFMMEDVRAYSYKKGLPRPERDQAWGAIVRRAFKSGLIAKIGQGIAKDPTRHRGYTALWERIA